MKVIFLLVIGIVAADSISLEGMMFEEWNLYKAEYNKSYEIPVENSYRMEIFLKNKYEIARHNLKFQKGEESYEMEINKFSDWLPEEIDAMNGFNKELRDRIKAGEKVEFPKEDVDVFVARSESIPYQTLNWAEVGAVSPVKDQSTCGCCYAFSAIGSLESLQYLNNGKMVPLSVQNIVDCSGKQGNMGCFGGTPQNTYNYIKDNEGVNTEEVYPYEGRWSRCRFNSNKIGAQITGYVKVEENEENLKQAVAEIGPISVAISVISSMLRYKKGIYYDSECKNGLENLNHAVLVVGYGTDPIIGEDYWIVKNSWGTDWGEQGYIRMARNKNNMCGIATLAQYPKIYSDNV